MKKTFQMALSVIMVGILLCTSVVTAYASTPVNSLSASEGISPYMTNCENASFTFIVESAEQASFWATYVGKEDTFVRAKLTVQVQKKHLGIFWFDADDEWVSYSTVVNGTFYGFSPIDGAGTYRAKFKLEIEGSTGVTDTIEDTIEYKYG